MKRQYGDGLMDQPNYELDKEALKTLKWTDLVKPAADDISVLVEGETGEAGEVSETGETGKGSEASEASLNSSNIPTEMLAERKLVSLPLVNSLIHNRGYKYLTPVQAQTLFPILNNESVVVRAKTGTGKTAAFSIPIVQKALESRADESLKNKVKAVIVTPTRELAQQIADEIFKITQFGGGLSEIKVQSLVGGVPKYAQLKAAGLMKGRYGDGAGKVADIVVATPGRLCDVLEDPQVSSYFDKVQFRVYDEADRILDIGFEREMEEIRQKLEQVTNRDDIPLLLFSATADRKMQKFAENQSSARVKLIDTVPPNEPTANELVQQHLVVCSNWADMYMGITNRIVQLYSDAKAEKSHFKAIVFLPTTVMVDHFELLLKDAFTASDNADMSRSVFGVHGQRSQSSRQNRSDRFRTKRDAILVTTDVVARGMDFPNVSHVFQIGPPTDTSSYIHRIGRTARIGNSGTSYLYYTDHMRGFVDALAKMNIKPEKEVYEVEVNDQNAETEKAFKRSVESEEYAQDLLYSLMSYMTNFKGKFPMDSSRFIKDMDPFVKLLGLSELRLGGQLQQAWRGRENSGNNRRRGTGYGSSRRSRMRW